MFSAESLAAFLQYWGFGAVLISLIISIIIAVAGILPSIFITAANIIIFGPLYGFLLSWAGEVLGALISFYLYRLGFKKKTEELSNKYKILNRITSSKGLRAGIIIFQSRLIPFIPSGFVTLAGAVSNIDSFTFLTATALGKLPSIALEALVSYDFINFNKNWIRLLLTSVSILVILFLLKTKNEAGVEK